MTTFQWCAGRYRLNLQAPIIMGIVNATPDSFSDGGQYPSILAVLRHCESLVQAGVGILDVGGESTRPGAIKVSLEEELKRVVPILRELVGWGLPISIDTYKPGVMQAALELGVDIINDVNGLRAEESLQVVQQFPTCGLCVMHGLDHLQLPSQPNLRHDMPMIDIVSHFLSAQLDVLLSLGVSRDRLVIDPGIGFGKSAEANFSLLRQQQELLKIHPAILVGWSRKSSLGAITGRPVSERGAASLAAALAAIQLGARIVRVHDVQAMTDALKVWRSAGLVP